MSKLAVKIAGIQYEIEVNFLPQAATGEATAGFAPAQLLVKVNRADTLRVVIPDIQAHVSQMEWLIIDEKPYEVILDNDLHWIRSHRDIYALEIRDMEAGAHTQIVGDQRVKAPIPGLVTQVLVSVDDRVTVGQPLLVLEAMKMENEIRATCSGVVKVLNVKPGQNVTRHEVLVEIA